MALRLHMRSARAGTSSRRNKTVKLRLSLFNGSSSLATKREAADVPDL